MPFATRSAGPSAARADPETQSSVPLRSSPAPLFGVCFARELVAIRIIARRRHIMKNSKADQTQLLAELRRLESKPPKRADRLIARHLKCEESQSLAHAVAEAARRSSSGAMPVLEAPSELLPPLI